MRHRGVRPLVVPGGRVTVDGHPICAVCGAAVAPTGPDLWRHVPIGKPPPRRSKWLSAVTWPELRKLRSYQEFTARYPWTVRPELGSGVITTEDDWREGVRRLHAYHTRLSVLSRRRALRPGENPYLGLVQVLAGASAGEPAPAIDCEWCFARHPPAMALRVGKHRVEYPREIVEAMPAALRRAFEQSPNLMMK